MRVKTLSNTNSVTSRHIRMEKVSLPVAVRRSKTPVPKVYFQPWVVCIVCSKACHWPVNILTLLNYELPGKRSNNVPFTAGDCICSVDFKSYQVC